MSASTVYGVNETLRRAGTLIDYQKVGGVVKVLTERYYSTAIEAASSIMCPYLPANAIVLGGWLQTEALGTGVTLQVKVGTTAISSALSCAAAGTHAIDTVYTLDNGPLSASSQVSLLTAGATMDANKEILLVLFYTHEG